MMYYHVDKRHFNVMFCLLIITHNNNSLKKENSNVFISEIHFFKPSLKSSIILHLTKLRRKLITALYNIIVISYLYIILLYCVLRVRYYFENYKLNIFDNIKYNNVTNNHHNVKLIYYCNIIILFMKYIQPLHSSKFNTDFH